MTPEEILEGLKQLEYVPKGDVFICHDPYTPGVCAALEKMDREAWYQNYGERLKYWVLMVPEFTELFVHKHNHDTVIYYPQPAELCTYDDGYRNTIGTENIFLSGDVCPIRAGIKHRVPASGGDRYTVVGLYE